MADQKEYGNYDQKISNRQDKRLKKTQDYAGDNYNQEEYNPEMVVHVTPAGHVKGYDNTKGKERTFDWHMSGTGYEILKDGSKIEKTIGNHWSYIKGGSNVTTQGNADLKYVGHFRQSIDGGSHEEIKGNSTQYVGGSSANHTVGNHTRSSTGSFTMASEQALVLTSKGKGQNKGQVTISLGGKTGTLYISSSVKHVVFKSTQDFMVEAPKVGFKCDKFSVDCSGDIEIKAGGKLHAGAGGELHLGSDHVFLSKNIAESPQMKTTVIGTGNAASDPSPDFTDHFPEQEDDVMADAPSNTTPA